MSRPPPGEQELEQEEEEELQLQPLEVEVNVGDDVPGALEHDRAGSIPSLRQCAKPEPHEGGAQSGSGTGDGPSSSSPSHQHAPTPAAIPPGAINPQDFITLYCSSAAVALTLLGTLLPVDATTDAEERDLFQALWLYVLCATTVLMYFLKMQDSMEHCLILFGLDQLLIGLWLMLIILLPSNLKHVVKHGMVIGSFKDWSLGMIANSLLLSNYALLSGVALLFDASLCFHAGHRRMVYPAGQALRARRFWASLGSLGVIAVLCVVELFTTAFNQEYVYTVPIVLVAESVWLLWRDGQRDPLAEGQADDDVAVDAGAGAGAAPGPLSVLLDSAPSQLSGLGLAEARLSVLPETGARPGAVPSLWQLQHPPPQVASGMRLVSPGPLRGLWALPTRRMREMQELFHSVSGTALIVLGATLPAAPLEEGRFREFGVKLFMCFWASIAVLIYWLRMRRLLAFRRFLFLHEQALLCVWVMAVIIIPKMMELVAVWGGGHGSIRHWTPSQSNNFILLSVHVSIDLCGTLLAASLGLWERRVGFGRHHSKGVSLRSVLRKELMCLAVSSFLLIVELFVDSFTNLYIWLIPLTMLMGEVWLYRWGRAGRST